MYWHTKQQLKILKPDTFWHYNGFYIIHLRTICGKPLVGKGGFLPLFTLFGVGSFLGVWTSSKFTGCEVMVITYTKWEWEAWGRDAGESFLSELEEEKVEMIILLIRKPRPRAFEGTKLLVAISARFGGPDSGVFRYFPTLSHPYCLFLKPSSANYK